jgi:hypothetical protein
MEYVIAICLVIIIYQLAGIKRSSYNTYNSSAIINNNLRILLTGFNLLLKDKKDKDTYNQIALDMDKENQGFVDDIQGKKV